MNILVTVGTYAFDPLIAACSKIESDDYSFTYQIGQGEVFPSKGDTIRYADDFSALIQASELVITHAGAGSIYSLLEMNKKIVVVPNLDRLDLHQLEISRYIEQNNYGEVCRDVEDILTSLHKAISSSYNSYENEGFFLGEELNDLILSSLDL